MNNAKSYKTIAFFTDRCGNDELPFYISINGVEHELRLLRKRKHSPIYFAGTYAGDGLKVEVQPGRLLRRYYDQATPTAKKEVVGEEYRVLVIVKKGTVVEKIPGVFWYGR